MTAAQRRRSASWLREELGELGRWIDSSPQRWPHARVVVAMRAILAGDAQWRLRAADVLR